MNCNIPVPVERLLWFQEKLGIEGRGLERLKPYRSLFASKKKAFAESLYKYFYEIRETRAHIEHERRRGHLKEAWMEWFESLFNEGFSNAFLASHWRSGLRHVEVNIDHRFITLAYSFVRQFCRQIVKNEIPALDQEPVLEDIGRMVDFCLLIETQAFIDATTQCDLEVVKGISHQVRNPLTIIGGYVQRLKREADPGSPIHRIYDTILDENKRLENMVGDVGVYSEMFQKEPYFTDLSLEALVSRALGRLEEAVSAIQPEINVAMDPGCSHVHGDPEDLERLFYYLLQNSLEAIDLTRPCIKITAKPWPEDSRFIEASIFNTGGPLSPEDAAHLFVPFYSSKQQGTGFGLPIAQLAARKNLGELYLEPVPNEGMRCVIKLPASVTEASQD